jgi:hypothetical protein
MTRTTAAPRESCLLNTFAVFVEFVRGGALGSLPAWSAPTEVTVPHAQRAIDEGVSPAAVADLVADAVAANRFWVFTDPEFIEIALRRWHGPSPRVSIPKSR